MSVAELSTYTSVSKYARYVEEEKRRETWEEAVSRNEGMMLDRFPHLQHEVKKAYNYVRERKILGSMRAMQFGGKPALKHNARMYNCTASYCDRLRFFQECFYLLLCGCGTGFSVQEHHVAKLPNFSKKRRAGVKLPKKVFTIPDCIEGWADSEGALLASYHDEPIKGFEEWQDCEVVFDSSQVRPNGSPLSCGIGRAPGPGPLLRALEESRRLLNKSVTQGVKLSSLDAYDLTMFFADASVAGGVRRSATICIFSPWDLAMAMSKTGNWMRENPQRARSNNSAALLRNGTTWEEFFKLFEHTRQFGEPGFYWTDDYDIIPNPCVEVGFWPRLLLEVTAPTTYRIQKQYDGPVEKHKETNNTIIMSGWQMCNLSTLNGRTTQDKDDFYERCEEASKIGTFQAAFTDFPYLGEVTERIVRREALLGVAICGMMHKPKLFLDPDIQQHGARVVLETNERIAKACGINPCARGTCIKPDGKSSAVLESEPGIHPGHSRRYFRIVQANTNERPYQHFRSVNPEACEPSIWSKTGTDDCIRFCIEEPEGTALKSEMPAVAMLDNVRLTYMNWIQSGKRPELCTQPTLSNNVSNTVTVRPHEWDEVARNIYEHRHCFAGVSLAPDSCDKDFAQAPYTAVYTPDEICQMYNLKALQYAHPLLDMLEGAEFRDLWDACDLALGFWPESTPRKASHIMWVNALKIYAFKYHNENLRRATYCLKDVYNWKLWCKLKDSYRNVDYSTMVEEHMTTDLQGEAACAGGACVISL